MSATDTYNQQQGKATPAPMQSNDLIKREPFQATSMQQAKVATIELALSFLDEETSERLNLQRQGVRSYKIGDLSETFTDSGSFGATTHAISIVSPHLGDWLSGGYDICPTRTRK